MHTFILLVTLLWEEAFGNPTSGDTTTMLILGLSLGEYPTKADFEEAARYLYNFSDFYYNRRYDD